MEFINLDVLKAPSKKIRFLGKDFELGYIPSGIAIPIVEDWNHVIATQKETDSDERILSDEIHSISVFCSLTDPSFTEQHIRDNATTQQLDAFYQHLVFAVYTNFLQKQPDSDANSEQKKTTSDL